MFLGEADEALARLTISKGAPVLAADLHFLKGAALNLGFSKLSSLCQDGERLANAGDTNIDVDAVRTAYAECRAAFESGMAQAFAA
ncbi:MAG: Hpt domain-containing protein [Cypionkella sp.]